MECLRTKSQTINYKLLCNPFKKERNILDQSFVEMFSQSQIINYGNLEEAFVSLEFL